MKDYWCDLNNTIRNSMQAMNMELLARKHKKGEKSSISD